MPQNYEITKFWKSPDTWPIFSYIARKFFKPRSKFLHRILGHKIFLSYFFVNYLEKMEFGNLVFNWYPFIMIYRDTFSPKNVPHSVVYIKKMLTFLLSNNKMLFLQIFYNRVAWRVNFTFFYNTMSSKKTTTF